MTVDYSELLHEIINYPESDGEPVAESESQMLSLFYAVSALRIYFRNHPDVYVGGNLLLYYEEGNPRAVVAPDVMVVMGGSHKRKRRSYLLWKEKKGPDFVLEITSKSTVGVDQGIKRGLYAYLGVREYFQYDPTEDYMKPPLQGLRLVDDHYLAIPVVTNEDDSLTIHSNVLGLDLHLKDGEFHFADPDSGELLRSHEESEQERLEAEAARLEAERIAEAEKMARLAAEARLVELETRLRDLEEN
jgi:Uma2 family endonuclease